MIRLFFAALPDASTSRRAATAAAALRLDPPARLVRERNFHVTLAFVGSVPDSQLPLLRQLALDQRSKPIELRLDAYEYWPDSAVVVGTASVVPSTLDQLWRRLHESLADLQLPREVKRLRPHVTLAKKVLQAPVLPAISSFEWPIREFSLMRSDTSGAQSAYTVVDTWPLLDNCTET